ncbi:superoxide dismutase family protein [Enhygromyxa salina]|uniref:Superoxide dismutase [Cu-Zn] n=1 Tax=Enhygromyxa salina TaxID=215803 RepID=A0A2S9XVN4_9BACT|nr:superoxide dismutase family protein [Enhygromyxa salina]PRP96937.1 Superoxide dismutase-like protein YojM precursor [Enhygromyxa salina]
MNTPRQLSLCCAAVILCLAPLSGCKDDEDDARTAVAQLTDSDGKSVGEATFTEVATGIKLEYRGFELPAGSHGFHIHETGKCDPPSFESAGGHFNPTGAAHGLEGNDGAHVGDLPNLVVNADGPTEYDTIIRGANLEKSDTQSLLAGDGTALVIHRDPDDGQTDPAGNAGPRIACGVIKAR